MIVCHWLGQCFLAMRTTLLIALAKPVAHISSHVGDALLVFASHFADEP
jgi:hypothetical protein